MATLGKLVCRAGVIAVALTISAVALCTPRYVLQPINVAATGTSSFVGLDDGNTLYGNLYNPVTKFNVPFLKRYGVETILDVGANQEGVISKVTGRIGFGYCRDSDDNQQGAYWQDSVLHLIEPSNGYQMYSTVGGSPDAAIYGRAASASGYDDVMVRNGSITELPYPYHQFPLGSGVVAANSIGMAVGYQSYIPAIATNPLSWMFGSGPTVYPAWDGNCQAADVNENGDIVCNSTDSGGYHNSRVFSQGGWSRLAGLPSSGNGSVGKAINDHGTVAGRVDGITGNGNGMTVWFKEDGYINHRLIDLLLINPGWNITGLLDINNKGVILGTYKVGTVTKYFLATPLSTAGH